MTGCWRSTSSAGDSEDPGRAEGERDLGAARAAREGVPDPELVERATRRRFTAEYKLRILRQAEACTQPGEIGALLRREGLYTSQLTAWRKQREQARWRRWGARAGARADPRDAEIAALRRRLSAPRRSSRRRAG